MFGYLLTFCVYRIYTWLKIHFLSSFHLKLIFPMVSFPISINSCILQFCLNIFATHLKFHTSITYLIYTINFINTSFKPPNFPFFLTNLLHPYLLLYTCIYNIQPPTFIMPLFPGKNSALTPP